MDVWITGIKQHCDVVIIVPHTARHSQHTTSTDSSWKKSSSSEIWPIMRMELAGRVRRGGLLLLVGTYRTRSLPVPRLSARQALTQTRMVPDPLPVRYHDGTDR